MNYLQLISYCDWTVTNVYFDDDGEVEIDMLISREYWDTTYFKNYFIYLN